MKQEIDISDPNVARWAVETGVISLRTSVRLECRDKNMLEIHIGHLRHVYGERLRIRAPHPNGRGGWIAQGSIFMG